MIAWYARVIAWCLLVAPIIVLPLRTPLHRCHPAQTRPSPAPAHPPGGQSTCSCPRQYEASALMHVKSASVQPGAGGEGGAVVLEGAHAAWPASPPHSVESSHDTTKPPRQYPVLSARQELSSSEQAVKPTVSSAVSTPGCSSGVVGCTTGAHPGSEPVQVKPSAQSVSWPAGRAGVGRKRGARQLGWRQLVGSDV